MPAQVFLQLHNREPVRGEVIFHFPAVFRHVAKNAGILMLVQEQIAKGKSYPLKKHMWEDSLWYSELSYLFCLLFFYPGCYS